MSYAQIASHHTDGPQPHADTALLNTQPSHTDLPDVEHKVSVVPQSYKAHPQTETSIMSASIPHDDSANHDHNRAKSHLDHRKEKDKKYAHDTAQEGAAMWDDAVERILRPGVLGGVVGIVNVGLIGAFGYQLYTKPSLRSDTRALGTAAVGALVLFGAEGFVAEAYRRTPAGQEEERRARDEGASIYRHSKEVILRPGVAGGLVGILNLGILGGLGYVTYTNWDRPYWDRKTVLTTAAGLVALSGIEGYLGAEYKETEYPKRK